MSPSRAALALCLALLVGACGASPSPGASVSLTTPRATAAARSGDEVTELERGGPLPPGRYTRSGFLPRVTFELGAGEWYAEQLYSGFFDVQQDVGSPDVIAVQFARPRSVFGAGGGSVAVGTAAEAAEVLRGHPGLTVLAESPALMDGHRGVVIEVAHAGASAEDVSLMMVPPGPLGIAPERGLWISFLDTDAGLLAVMVGGSVANWEQALATAEPVLESVTIGD